MTFAAARRAAEGDGRRAPGPSRRAARPRGRRTAATRAATPSSTWTAPSSRSRPTPSSARSLGEARVLVDGEGITLGRTPALPRPAPRWCRATAWPSTSTRSTSPPGAWPRRRPCALLAGMPVVSKPATSSALVAHRIMEILVEAQVPARRRALAAGGRRRATSSSHVGSHQDVVAFTGSSDTGIKIRSLPQVIAHSVRVNVEADSLNAAVLGPGRGARATRPTSSS